MTNWMENDELMKKVMVWVADNCAHDENLPAKVWSLYQFIRREFASSVWGETMKDLMSTRPHYAAANDEDMHRFKRADESED